MLKELFQNMNHKQSKKKEKCFDHQAQVMEGKLGNKGAHDGRSSQQGLQKRIIYMYIHKAKKRNT